MTHHTVDFIEAGQGPTVLLLHSSVAGAGQWRNTLSALSSDFHLLAVNLIGYGKTPAWGKSRLQSLEDQARLVEPLLPDLPLKFSVVGHSFGGSVAMKVAELYPDRVDRLVLVEPNPFYLLKDHSEVAAYEEALALRDCIKSCSDAQTWRHAAEVFADYWTGSGSWDAMNEDRQAKFIQALKPNFHEWDCVMYEETTLEDWTEAMPQDTVFMEAERTVGSIKALTQVLLGASPHWRKVEMPEGGHMAPLTHPHSFNPLLQRALSDSLG